MESTQGALTIDASGPSQEQDEFINRQVQDLQKLIEPLVHQALTSTSGGDRVIFDPGGPEEDRRDLGLAVFGAVPFSNASLRERVAHD